MAFCPQCGAPFNDGATSCPQCGAVFAAAPNPNPQPQQQNYQFQQQYQQQQYQQYQPAPAPVVDPFDHTADFDAQDISDNKVFSMLPYLLGTVGIIIALLAAQKSAFAMFHVREALKITVTNILLGVVSAVLCWTFIVPIAGFICIGILSVIQIIMFFRVCKGKAKEAPIICKLKFLK